MKNFISLSILTLLFISCSGGDDNSDTENTAPTVPVLTLPADNKLCVDNTVNLEWKKSTDKNKDEIYYQIEIALDNQFEQIIQTTESSSNSQQIELNKNTAYYWRIKATDSEGLSSAFSKTYKFYTAGDAVVNHLPFAPELVSPAVNITLNNTTAALKWNATDADNDILSYDVYFGSVNPPTTKIKENYTSKTADVTLQPAKEYFWRIVAKDNKGGETVGQIWKFKSK
ncbi:fibronectin type III domain-containing protein [Flavobacterium pectinovorum]|uniref:glycoside hydrolase family 78 protein n=1 Tax=Flavobacterium pectinovorum TaxID=29533 RepID=UPI001FAB5E81|nr:fibronectin type III domain-containing protein [Flavobacterium pectinovorum]MCI9844582.1 fibronectin type III domain-containing protein [Flavobacterium pectinovorum]